MKRILLLLALFLSLQGYGQKQTIITGEITNRTHYDQRVVTINYLDPTSTRDVMEVKLSADHKFKSRYDLLFAQNITLTYGDHRINLFISPADSIHITIDMNRYRKGDDDAILFSGNGAEINNQFTGLYNYLSTLKQPQFNLLLPPQELVKEVERAIVVQCDSMERYATEHQLSPFVTNWARTNIKFTISNGLMGYAKRDNPKRLELYTDSLFDVYNNDNFQSAAFQNHLIALFNPLMMSNAKVRECMQSVDVENGSVAAIEMMSELPESHARDLMAFMLLSESIVAHPSVYEKIPDTFFGERELYKRLEKLYSREVNIKFKKQAIRGVSYLDAEGRCQEVPEQDFFDYLKETYPGKVIYIDVWATWCIPCCKEFAPAKELHKCYRGKEVVFVNLCLSSQMEEWRSTLLRLTVQGENYFFDDDASAVFMNAYQLSGYPTYLILDKKGAMVSKNAPRPTILQNVIKAIDTQLNK